MSEGIKKYIIISASILCILVALGICWLFQFNSYMSFIFTYLIGFFDGMIMLGVTNYDERRRNKRIS